MLLLAFVNQSFLSRYRAGADTGFVIENEGEFAQSVRRATVDGAAAAAARRQSDPAAYAAEEASDVFRTEPSVQGDMTLNNRYAFGYSSSQGRRSETADDDGTVRGSYTIVGADGRPVEVRYRAGADIGYVVENMDEVIAATTPT